MGTIALQVPQLGQSDATEEAKVASDFTALQALLNGNIDTNNLSPTAGITPGQLATDYATAPSAVTSPGALANNTPRTPNTRRPTLVTLEFVCAITSSGGGGGGSTAVVSIDSYSTVGTVGMSTTTTVSASWQQTFCVTFLVPANKAYRFVGSNAGGGVLPTCTVRCEETL